MEPVHPRGGSTRVLLWTFHLALPVLALWLLLARPQFDVRLEHHPGHFWLVLSVAALNAALAVVINHTAQRRSDPRLYLVAMAFLAAAAFLGLHAAATPGVVLAGRNSGFDFATPVGLTIAALFAAFSAVDWPASALRWLTWLRAGLLFYIGAWAGVSLSGTAPLDTALPPAQAHRIVVVLTVVAVLLYGLAALRYHVLYRQRRTVVLLSIVTAYVLLAESMAALAVAPNWHASWWEWHLLMTIAFWYVAYSAYTQFRYEGSTAGLFDAAATEETVRRIRAEYGSALETLVSALRRRELGQLTADEMTLITAGLTRRFGLTDGQTAVLGRAAAALAAEREQIRRLDALVGIGHQSQVLLAEGDLLRQALTRVADGFDRLTFQLGLLVDGRLRFPPELGSQPVSVVDDELLRAAGTVLADRRPSTAEPGLLVLPLTVKEHVAGVLAVRHPEGEISERDTAMLSSVASQLSIGLENVRLYRQLDSLFRQYMSPEVATALIADPSQAALGGAMREVTVIFADLRGYSTFAESSSPLEIVAMLNRYFEVATAVILAQGGTIVQYIGDALMVMFNAPTRQPDHAVRAARAALDMQRDVDAVAAATPGYPRFRIGVNTGEALIGNIGSELLRNYNATGDAVNVAARLEATAEPGQVVIGAATYAELHGLAEVTPLGDLQVKGRRAPVTAYVLHRLRDGARQGADRYPA